MNIFSTATADSLKAASNPFYLAPRDALSNPIQASDPAVIAANGDTSGFFYDKIEGEESIEWRDGLVSYSHTRQYCSVTFPS